MEPKNLTTKNRWASCDVFLLHNRNAGNIMIGRKSAKLTFHHVARKKSTQLQRRCIPKCNDHSVGAPTLHSQLFIKKYFFNPAQRRRSYAVIFTFWDAPTL